MHEGTTLSVVADRTGGQLLGDPGTRVTDVTHDSREVADGALFVAVRGFEADGHEYLSDAIARGAGAICVEEPQATDVPQLIVPDGRVALAQAAAAVFGDPSYEVEVAGITGTNGKTTVARLLEAIAQRADRRPGVIGTLGARIAGRHVPTARTTPEASDTQRLLREMVSDGVDLVAMEVSSHALALHRVDETRFRVACFTNLSQDHLDFHTDMETYFRAKERLFRFPGLEAAAVWIGAPEGRRIAARMRVPTLGVNRVGEADVWASEIDMSFAGSRFIAHLPDAKVEVSLNLAGDFNIDNALLAAACAHLIGLSPDDISRGIADVPSIRGRFAPVVTDHPFDVVVDYAHTPDGIATVLEAARSLTDGRVIIVFGAGGDRDRSKRSGMGKAAAEADVVVVTSDNPRSERPSDIAAEVSQGVRDRGVEPHVVIDRRLAIRHAIGSAQPGDVVLVLGKGHERSQEIDGRFVAFDDADVALEELAS